MRSDPSTTSSRLAWLQRIVGLLILVAAVGTALVAHRLGAPWALAVLAGLAVGLGHAWILALEFVLLQRIPPGAGVPPPTPRQMLRAWWGEVVTGLLVFGWRQPYAHNRHRDWLEPETARGRRGVLLIHGFVCNRGLWNPWMPRLRAIGAPHLAVNLEPVFGGIEAYVSIIDRAVERLHAATGVPPLVVAHSMGGLALRAWLRGQAVDGRLHAAITIGTPHQGTWLARYGFSANTRQMRRQGEWVQALAAQEEPRRRERFTCFYSHTDNIVFPASTGMLEGADNRHIPGVAHVHLVYQPEVWSEVCRRLAEPVPPAA